ncbi:YbaN family protein [Sphingomonas sp. DG1-23]|uniref:YbaN family protein n=1 Tax=Sphingomonas sp. DG1-23 TaxID=3068316 RepID=UPI00273DA6F2|nr:YbaN family protein [Sphingomonas sp. DG1-23]MDP5278703.1 YbaN family protein [Sphingomonas sp. DG1-23]
MPPSPERSPRRLVRHVSRTLWLALGLLFVVLGFIGALVPLMPTTIFLILAAGCFARSSPRLEAWLLGHPRFGQTLRAWQEEGAIGPRAKVLACTGIALGYGLFWWGARPGLAAETIVGLVMAGCAAFIVSRPAPQPKDAR